MTLGTFDLNQLQKVEYKNDPDTCSVSFTDYLGPASGKTLLVTDVPAAAGSMLAASGLPFIISSTGGTLPNPPIIAIEYQTPVATNAGGANVDIAKYAGRLELRDFT